VCILSAFPLALCFWIWVSDLVIVTNMLCNKTTKIPVHFPLGYQRSAAMKLIPSSSIYSRNNFLINLEREKNHWQPKNRESWTYNTYMNKSHSRHWTFDMYICDSMAGITSFTSCCLICRSSNRRLSPQT
jgi:hypothetical protein